MHAQDRKPGEAQRKAAATRTPATSAIAAGTHSPEALRALQRSAGNAAVARAIEQERHAHGPGCGHHEQEAPVQRSAVHEVLRAPGSPLDESTRTDMEARLGADFSDVRLHTGPAAAASANEIGARAYTSGSHIVVGDGGSDRHTLAHELTHVIQQRKGPVAGTDNGAGLSVSDPSDRFEREAEETAAKVMSAPPAETTAPAAQQAEQTQASGPSAEHAVQRWPKGQHMQGYNRPGISNAATEEMLSYQGVGDRPNSPRAQQRMDGLQGENHFDRDLATNWEQNQRTGSTSGANPVPISRNHRLSDHYVGHIIEHAAEARRAAGANGIRVVQIDTAVQQFITACAPSGSVQGIMNDFRQFASANAGFEGVVGATSNNGRNLRAGHSRDNSTIKEHFDPGIIAGGDATPITESIMEAVNNLVRAQVIKKGLAEEALQPYRGWTSSDIRQRT
ncbi:eCIS core domain-containing protein [Streptomyces sp. CA-132043]|uniref:eCIS core domain-containing protein n=1 Tax=Streptomyces sp. CA-132043 TaxID=3240048 RepID=UPI003D8BC464